MKQRAVLPWFCVLPLLGATGCIASRSTASSAPPSDRALIEEAAIQSALQEIQSKKGDYRIGGADLLDITVFQQADLDRKLRVGQNGTISFPLIGTVRVGGFTVIEAEAAISRKLSEYVISPQVSVFIREYGNKRVFIFGEVQKPGSFELPTESKMTVLEAVSLAGGFTPIAAPDRTKVIRMVDGKSQNFTIEVSAITRRGEKQKDITLEPNDVVYIPQSFF